ncbi:Methyltransferase domain [Nesidiocoris tenuis]|uniref:Methyltransferase domain n=1 Tax=Nesidiocoris tenuis TaxID=355587 RepID=A0ABN7ACE9_9HEMI|nr:Methyltransferase domain [Nesidiocoris tenuis]
MNIFDRQAKLMQRNRAAAAADVEVYDYLKNEVGNRLADRVYDIKRKFGKVVDLGCGRGGVSQNITADCVDTLVMTDISESLLNQASLPEKGVKVERLVVDEEKLPFEKNSIDLVLSSLALHWVNNLPSTFMQVAQCLKNDGAFMGCVFGGDTLYELRSSLQLAEVERLGGISGHISPFTEVRDIGGLLNQAGFTLLTLDADEIIVNYPSIFELMWDLKGMAENNCAWKRSPRLRKDVMMAAGAIYQELYGSEDKIPATFQILYFLGWKPDPSQPKPAARGSATHSLADLEKSIKGASVGPKVP